MSKSIPAIVSPEILQWARYLDRISVEEIAQKLKVDVAKIEAWEDGSEYPTLPQAKKLAKQYRVPFAYFYLPDTPKKPRGLWLLWQSKSSVKLLQKKLLLEMKKLLKFQMFTIYTKLNALTS